MDEQRFGLWLPASVRDIARTISSTAWRTTIREDEVEDVISMMSEIVSVDGKYIQRRNMMVKG